VSIKTINLSDLQLFTIIVRLILVLVVPPSRWSRRDFDAQVNYGSIGYNN